MTNFLERVFSPLTNLLGNGLELFHAQGLPWWLSIALLTVVVRTLLFPLTLKQVRSMRAMQDLKPEMDRLRAKYQDNRQKQQEELMKLYQERQVNPLGGCLPLVIQMPIFITMFYVIRGFDKTHPDFASGGILWFQDLTAPDSYYLLPIISALTMLAASEITAKNLEPQQRWMMRILPVVFTVFLLYFPAGLFMYWITSNLVTLVQNYLIYNYGPGKKSPVALEKDNKDTKAKPETNKPDASLNADSVRKGTQQVKQPSASGRKKKRRR